jgi:hypothetical protein
MMNNEPDSIDPILKAMLDELRPTPPRNAQNVAKGKERYLAEVDSLLVDPVFSRLPAGKLSLADRLNAFKNSLGQRAVLTAVVAVVAILVFLFGSAGMTAYAAQSALPGDALYPVKTQLERTQASLSADAAREARLYLRFAERRLDEIAGLIAQGRFDNITQATNEFQTHIQNALGALQLVSAQDPMAAAQLAADITAQLTRYAQTLAGMLANVPEPIQAQLQRAIQASQDASRLEARPDGGVEIVGVIEEIGEGWIRIGGRVILLTPETEIEGDLAVGSLVKVHLVLAGGKLAARQISPVISPAVNENSGANENGNANDNSNGNANHNDNTNGNDNDGNNNDSDDDNSNDNGDDNSNDNGDDNRNDNGDDDNRNDNGDDNRNDNGDDDNRNDNGDDNRNDDSNDNGDDDNSNDDGGDDNSNDND